MKMDSGRWLLVLLGFSALALAFSTRTFLSLSMVAWEAEFGWSKSAISGIGAIGLVVMAVIAPIVGYCLDRFGARIVLTTGLFATGVGSIMISVMENQTMFVIAYCVVSALGFGIVSMHVVISAIAPLFDKNRGLATGIVSGGATGGQLLFVPVFSVLLASWGWRTGYVWMAALTIILGIIIWFVLRTRVPAEASHGGSGTTGIGAQLKTLSKSAIFHALFWSFTLCGFTTAGVIETHFLPYAAICGYGPIVSATAFGTLSAFNLLGMVLAGYLSDRFNNIALLAGIYILRAASLVLLLYISLDIKLLFLFSVMFGIFDYSTVPVTANLVATRLGTKSMGLIMGILAMGHALGAASGAWAGGFVYDIFFSYSQVWLISVALALLSATIVLMIAPLSRAHSSGGQSA
ncbi:MAG: MFS transporter [Pseudomonadota bacterium]